MNSPRRIFLWGVALNQPLIEITDERLRHRLRQVLRLAPGGEVIFLNDQAEEGKFSLIDPKRAIFKLIERQERTLKPRRRVTVAVAMPKRDALETLIQRATELGAAAIQPLITARSNLRLADNPSRWQTLIGEALEVTSWRETPTLRQPCSLESFLSRLTEPCYRLEQTGAAFDPTTAPAALAICVGPEGGWSEAERLLFSKYNALTVSLSQVTFRTETASLLALALLNFTAT